MISILSILTCVQNAELALMYALQKLLARDNTIRQGLKRKMAVLNESSHFI